MTYTLEAGYGSKIVVPGGGFLLNNEMGDFNAAPGLTDDRGLIGTSPNLARPGKRMLSSMAPTIIAKDGQLFMVTGTPGGRTIINTVLTTILNVIDFGMNAQEAVDAGRMHHQWLPDRLSLERYGFSADTIATLKAMGHTVAEGGNQGAAQVIVFNQKDNMLEGGVDRRAVGWRRCREIGSTVPGVPWFQGRVPRVPRFQMFQWLTGQRLKRLERWNPLEPNLGTVEHSGTLEPIY